MRVSQPTVEQVRLLPTLMSETIPPDWEDYNGHVNIQFYMTLFERGGWPMVNQLGMDEAYFRDRRHGLFDLEHHISYLRELHVGEQVSLYSRFVDRTAKRFHGLMFIVNDTRDRLACTIEFVSSGADLEKRATAPFPDDVSKLLDEVIARHSQLTWPPPLCGVMSA